MIALTEEMRQAIEQQANEPLRLVDPATARTFVLIRTEVYDRLKRVLYDDSEYTISEAYPLMDEVAAKAGWDDPAMDIYNDLAPREQP